MIELLLVVLLAFHLVCVNVGSAGPLICLALSRRERLGDDKAGDIGVKLAGLSLKTLVIGTLIGVLQGWIQWQFVSSNFVDILPVFGRKVFWGFWELVFSLVGLAGYYFWWRRPRPKSWQRLTHGFIAVLVSTNLLYHFPFLFSVMTRAAIDPSALPESVDSATFRGFALTTKIAAQATHFGFASIAVSGVALMWLALRQGADHLVRMGARIALAVTAIQLPVGFWLLTTLPPQTQKSVMGGDILSSIMLAVSVLSSFALLNDLSAVSFSDTSRNRVLRVTGWMLLIITLMTVVLRATRS